MKKLFLWTYFLFLVFGVIFKVYTQTSLDGMFGVNTRFFKTVTMCFENINTFWAISNVVGNTLPFFVFGLLLKNVYSHITTAALFNFFSSFFILCEIVQYVFVLGVCDVDDVFLNLIFFYAGIYVNLLIDKLSHL